WRKNSGKAHPRAIGAFPGIEDGVCVPGCNHRIGSPFPGIWGIHRAERSKSCWRHHRDCNAQASTNRELQWSRQEHWQSSWTTNNRGEDFVSTKPKILIVDDDPDLRRRFNLRLRANHYDTSYATDGFSAIPMPQKQRPDLIILDIGLPAGDGFVVLDRLQQSAALSAIPVI